MLTCQYLERVPALRGVGNPRKAFEPTEAMRRDKFDGICAILKDW